MNKKVYLLKYGKLGKWSLSKDLENSKMFFVLANNTITKSIFNADIIYSAWHNVYLNPFYYYAILLIKKIWNVHIITSVSNEIMPGLNIKKLFGLIDTWIVANSTTYDFLVKLKGDINIHKLPFFVDKKVFYPVNESKFLIASQLGIDLKKISNKLLIGSFQRDSEGNDLSKAKWQKDPETLVRICKKISDKNFVLILAGPRRHYIIRECRKHKIPYIFLGEESYINEFRDDLEINSLSEEKINLLYNLIDVYIISSKSESGPKAIIENSLCKTLVFSTDVGLAKDFIHPDLIYTSEDLNGVAGFITYVCKNKEKSQEYIRYNFENANNIMAPDNFLKIYKEISQ